MRVFMLGWEFPPHVSGGLGTACYGMTQALANQGTEITFVLPRFSGDSKGMDSHLDLRPASGVNVPYQIMHEYDEALNATWDENIRIQMISSTLFPYATEETYEEYMKIFSHNKEYVEKRYEVSSGSTRVELEGGYGKDLMSEVFRYSQAAAALAAKSDFDVIHAHDWMTYPAGMLIKRLTGKPLIVHIHAMEYDRSGQNVNTQVSEIERRGMQDADKVVAVSHYTRNLVIREYGIDPNKVEVVHNAVARNEAKQVYASNLASESRKNCTEKHVLFMGRITFQKGPDYFIDAAHMVLQKMPDVRFIMAGNGDMMTRMVRRAAQLRIGNRMHFTGFLRGQDVDRMYALSDLYVMPSVSEPFGIAPLEAMIYDVPVLISRQSGVSEVVENALKVDFWDVKAMADKICAVLQYPKLSAEIVKNSREELKGIRWENAAKQLNVIYESMI